MKKLYRVCSIFIMASMLVAMMITAQPVTHAYALAFTVTTTDDHDDGTCDADCTLREAINAANNNGSGSDSISLPSGTYTLTFGDQLPVVSSAIIINGTSPAVIQADFSIAAVGYRVFEVANNGGSGDLTLNNLNIKNGYCINANSCSSQDNPGTNGQGGAIFNGGKLALNNSTVSDNHSDGSGGAIYNYSGTLTVTGTNFVTNTAIGGDGGGIAINNGTVTVTSSNFVLNTGISGGGISSGGTLNVTASLFSTNFASGDGGGIGGSGKLSVKTSSFHDNSASRGGGLANSGGGPNNVSNNTFYNNSASSKGGGIFNYEDLNLTNNTFSANSAPSGGAFYSDPYQHENDPRFAVVTLKNNILANSTGGGDCFNFVNGTAHPVTGNNNLIETEGSSPCGTTAPITGTDPNLGTLAGFPLPQYYPLNAGSAAINAGDDAACAAAPVSNTSQNGVTRPQGAHCDIGSYEGGGATFGDVPLDHPLWKYIEALFQAGFTAGCSATPLMFCPDQIMDRAQSAVFMLRGQLGSAYTPPAAPWPTFMNDNWVGLEWAQGWAEGMWQEGLTSGCQASPLMFCPATQLPREQVVIFGLKMKYGVNYLPPTGTGTVFSDVSSTYWAKDWIEQAYKDGLLPSCGTDPITALPMFCPGTLVTRGWGAYVIVKAKGIATP